MFGVVIMKANLSTIIINDDDRDNRQQCYVE
jgi:hypothetical protein